MAKINGKHIGDTPGTSKVYYGGAVAYGYLLEDGTARLISQYPVLFAILGGVSSPFGSPDGFATQFNLPDSRRKVHVGSGGSSTGTLGNTVGSSGGEENHTLSSSESGVPSHGHSDAGHVHADPGGQTFVVVNAGGAAYGNAGVINDHFAAAGATGNGVANIQANSPQNAASAHNTLQPSLVVTKMIKY